ncbi:MAG: acyltransferase [Acidobacteriota bacterium]|nr:acyltransferase [Acidobacteriota bacterium]
MPSQHRYLFLDALRGVAALGVGLLHAGHIYLLGYRPEHGVLAVDFFFCLSGFVIAHAYEEKLRGGMLARRFVAMRLIRLYPMIALSILLGAVFPLSLQEQVQQHISSWQLALFVVTALFLLPAGLPYHLEAYPVNNPVWSLFFELFINAVYGKVAKKLSLRAAVAALVVLGVALSGAILQQDGVSAIGFTSYGEFLLGFLRVSYPFLAGVVIFRLTRQHPLGETGNWLVPAALLAYMLLTTSLRGSPWYSVVCVLAAVPLIVAMGTAVKVQSQGLNRVFAWLGTISYPFYLLHLPILRAFSFHLRWFGGRTSLGALAALLTAVVSAQALTYVYDAPLRAWLTTRFLRPLAALQQSAQE